MKTAEKKSATNIKFSACYFQSAKAANGKTLVIISEQINYHKI